MEGAKPQNTQYITYLLQISVHSYTSLLVITIWLSYTWKLARDIFNIKIRITT
jgi:hypothetical protein